MVLCGGAIVKVGLKGEISSLQVVNVDRREFELDIGVQLLVHVSLQPHRRHRLLADAQHFVCLSLVEDDTQELDGVGRAVCACITSSICVLKGLGKRERGWVHYAGFH